MPYLDKKNESVLESSDISHFTESGTGLSHMVTVTLIKIRLMFDLTSLQSFFEIGQRLPTEISENIRSHMVGDAIARRRLAMLRIDQTHSKPQATNLRALLVGQRR